MNFVSGFRAGLGTGDFDPVYETSDETSNPLGRVAVLLATHNGERYLAEQLRSIEDQTWSRIDILVSDDASSDSTLGQLEDHMARWPKGRFSVVEGPNRGFSENFRSLILRHEPQRADYVAFCDQDDIWNADKLENAIAWLSSQPANTPALYCGRTLNFRSGRESFSPLFRKPPCFQNALVQSIAGGNTMVMNRCAFAILRKAARRGPFVSHDWFSYMLITGAGGRVFYNPVPDIRYRQHEGNLVGENNSWGARVLRMRYFLQGRFRDWTDRNLANLEACEDLLNDESRRTLALFREARTARLHRRMALLFGSGVFRQTFKGQLGLFVLGGLFRLI
ncbi:glycosyl transferase family 2 [Zhengella mangrovi]|uniref:Glycosyl transferase family 2 n=1 Tax=Zhengella mangrovi TaxID=1982044 RepID=A0A2G1QJ74_9HYPH|nr:glycosyltransferase [Zhengella mangrovi]PHP65576.1 glycosyl transferase family 2 [Zhengella mangrovi]